MNRSSVYAALMVVVAVCAPASRADDTALPGQGYAASRYEVLWTKSPFSVATPTDAPSSPDYSLIGLAQFDGVSYASLLDKQKQEHFVVTSEKPVNGLTLVSVNRAQDPSNSSAVIQRNGESLTLKLEVQSGPPPPANGPAVVNAPPTMAVPSPGNPNPQVPDPNASAYGPAQAPPPPLFHRHTVHLPTQPPH